MAALEDGRAALASGDWQTARRRFGAALDEDPAAAEEGIAQASWWLDDAEGALAARERAYRLYRERGDDVGAARAATSLAWDCSLFGVGRTVAIGWLGRARTLLADTPEAVEHGWLAVRVAEFAIHVDRDPSAALESARAARAIGARQRDGDLAIVGLGLEGLALVDSGQIESGMQLLDEAVAAATAGDVRDLMWMGKVCCFLISACNGARDIARAAEWCQVVEAMCRQRDLAPLFAVCRTQYASVLVAQGTWGEAERELGAVITGMQGSQRASLADAAVNLGELRRRQGRLDEAERLFADAEFHPLAIVGRGEVHLARGDTEAALASARALLERTPSANRLARVRALELSVRSSLALGDRESAEAAASELRATAEAIGTGALLAAADYADGLLAEPADAVAPLEQAVRGYSEGGLRHDAARARLALARALAAIHERNAASEHLAIARRELTALDAGSELREAAQLASEVDGDGDAGPLSPRELDVLRLVAEGLSNQEIADRLVLSRHTVHRHVANILRKLDQPSRAAAATAALRAGLI